MRLRLILTVLNLFNAFSLATCTIVRSDYAIKDYHELPDGWKYKAKAPPDQMIELHIALKQADFDILEKHLYEGEHFLDRCLRNEALLRGKGG